jgi:tetratricopeptide (TPR) repeat protein
MRRGRELPAALLAISALLYVQAAFPEQSQAWVWCARQDVKAITADLQLSGCTTIIQSGSETPANLANAHNNRANAYLANGDAGRAMQDYDEAIRLKPDYAIAFSNRGNAEVHLRQYDKALSDYQQSLRLDSSRAEKLHRDISSAWTNRCFDASIDTDHDAAISACTRAIDSTQITVPRDLSITLVNRGSAYESKNDYEHALADYNAAIRADEGNLQAYTARGHYWRLRGQESDAQADYDRALAKPYDANEYNDRLDRARAYRAKGNKTQALAELDAALAIDGTRRQARLIRADIRYDLNDYQRAIADYAELLRIDPRDGPILLKRGDAYLGINDFGQAMSDYNAAIPLLGQAAAGYKKRGWVHRLRGEFDLSIADYTEAVRLEPHRASNFSSRGNVYLAKGDWKQALEDYDRGVHAEPERAYPLDSRAGIRAYMGDYAGALEDRNEVVRLEPRDADWRTRRAWTLFEMGRTPEALAGFGDAIRMDPNASERYRARGQALLRLGRVDEAAADYDQAIKLEPALGANYAGRAEVALFRGHPLDGLADAELAQSKDPDSEANYWKGRLHFAAGQLDAATADFTALASQRPFSTTAPYYRGFCKLSAGDFSGAEAEFRRVTELSVLHSYTRLMLHVARLRSGQNPNADTAQFAALVDPRKWPSPVFSFFLGRISAEQMIAAAKDPSPYLTRSQEAEAYYLAGESLLASKRPQNAKAMFEETLKRKLPDKPVSMAAVAELRNLEGAGTSRPHP